MDQDESVGMTCGASPLAAMKLVNSHGGSVVIEGAGGRRKRSLVRARRDAE